MHEISIHYGNAGYQYMPKRLIKKRTPLKKLPPILYKGSVKNVRGAKGANTLFFEYSDRYSIFDWGEMPDQLPYKGEALAMMADLFFQFLADPHHWQHWSYQEFEASPILEKFRRQGVPSHSLGLVAKNVLEVKKVNVLRPKAHRNKNSIVWDYTAYVEQPVDTLVPLEVIFRLGVPSGSSFLKRAEQNPKLLKEVGLWQMPKEGTRFHFPVVEVSTKLEPTDRMLSTEEAKNIAGLNAHEWHELVTTTQLLAIRLSDLFHDLGVELWDGKFEFAFVKNNKGGRSFMLVDSLGLDEMRVLADGMHLSKEFLRQVYRDSSWCKAVEKAKASAKKQGKLDWKKAVKQSPKVLPAKIKNAVSEMYLSFTNTLAKGTGRPQPFPKAKPFSAVIQELKKC